MNTKLRWYRFWINSGHGTNRYIYQRLPHRLDPDEVKSEVEEWCYDNFRGCYEFSYGWTKVRRPPKTWLRSRIKIIQRTIETQKQELIELKAML